MRIAEGRVRIIPGARLAWPPRLVVSGLSVIVGPYGSAEQHEVHLLDTTGAGDWQYEGSDEFRFSKDDGMLVSLWLQVPDMEVHDERQVEQCVEVPGVSGALRLAGEGWSTVPRSSRRSISSAGDFLLCVNDSFSGARRDSKRLNVATDLDLLFCGDVYGGWLLKNPERYLSNSWEKPSESSPDPELAVWLKEYFTLTQESIIERLEDGDADQFRMLLELQNRINLSAGCGQRRKVLHESIGELVDWFS
jgi:hypothetical protein